VSPRKPSSQPDIVGAGEGLPDLPEGWTWALLRDVVGSPPNISPSDEPNREFGYIDISSICNRTFRVLGCKRLMGSEAPSRARRPVRAGDVLFSNVRTYLRNIALVHEGLDADVCSTGFTVLRPTPAIEPRFLFRYVLTDDFLNRVTPQQTGTHYPATSDRVVLGEAIPLPPLAEQKRIVAKVEELLARVNAARERLARVPAILKRFRKSVLAAACSGRLTADWRDGKADLEPASKLIELIRSERRRGVVSPKRSGAPIDSTRAEFLGGQNGDGEAEAGLPSEWTLVALSEVLHYTRSAGYGVLQPGPDVESGVPMVRVCDLSDGTVLAAQMKRISPRIHAQYRRTQLEGDEVLVTLVGTIGRTAVAPKTIAGANIARAVAMLPLCPHVLPRFVHFALAQPAKNAELYELAREVARKTLNLGLLKEVMIPLAPLDEQREIVRRVEELFEYANAIEKRVAMATARDGKLTQAILAKAFRGELVPTEADLARAEARPYEPASALLARIWSTQPDECSRGQETRASNDARGRKRRDQ